MPSIEQLRDFIECTRTRSVETLCLPEIRGAVGRNQTQRMVRLAKHAGLILISGNTVRIKYSRNGLYLMPTHDDVESNLKLYAGRGSHRRRFDVGEFMLQPEPFHATLESQKRVHIIGLPLDMEDYLIDPECASVEIHELTHADQFRRKLKLPEANEIQLKAMREAEAYTNQFLVANTLMSGVLAPIVGASIGEPDATMIVAEGPDLDVWRTTSNATRNAIGAVIRNATHGYVSDGSAVPSEELITEYEKMGLLDSI